MASPSSATVIGTELLRGNMPGTRPDEIIFTILKPARYGEILVDGIKNTVFTQLQVSHITFEKMLQECYIFFGVTDPKTLDTRKINSARLTSLVSIKIIQIRVTS